MAKERSSLSYSSVHWRNLSRHQVEEEDSWVVDVARLEDALRSKANAYANEQEYDYAQRVVGAGSSIVQEAISFGRIGRPAVWSQMLHSAEGRCRIPQKAWAEAPDEVFTVPSELMEFFQEAWANFAANNVTIPEKYRTLN